MLLQHIVDQTNVYAGQNHFQRANYQWTDTNVNELQVFLGIIIATGLVVLPSFRYYWKTDSIFGQPGIVKGMSWNRFEQYVAGFILMITVWDLRTDPQGMIGFTKLGLFLM